MHGAFAGRLDLLIVNGKSDVRDAAMIQRVAAGFVSQHLDLVRVDDFLVVDADVFEQRRHIHFLLKVTAFQVGIGLSGEREHRGLIKFRVVQAVEQMNTSRP